MIEQFSFDIQLIFAILNGKVSAAINRKLSRNFRQNGVEITPEQWTVLLFLWEKDGVTQQELCNATFKDKPSMTIWNASIWWYASPTKEIDAPI